VSKERLLVELELTVELRTAQRTHSVKAVKNAKKMGARIHELFTDYSADR